MNEHRFIKSIRNKLPKEIYSWKIQAMMNNGLPDLYFSGPTGDLWLEVKYVKLPKRDSTIIYPGLSDLQLKWLNDRHKEGRNVGLLVGSEAGCWFENCRPFNEPLTKNSFTVDKQKIVEWIIKQTLG